MFSTANEAGRFAINLLSNPKIRYCAVTRDDLGLWCVVYRLEEDAEAFCYSVKDWIFQEELRRPQ